MSKRNSQNKFDDKDYANDSHLERKLKAEAKSKHAKQHAMEEYGFDDEEDAVKYAHYIK